MNIATSTAPGRHITKRGYLLSALAAAVLAASGLAPAQTTPANPESTLTRAQAKMERDEFLKTHRYDTGTENWVLKSGVEAPAGVKSRAEIKAHRDLGPHQGRRLQAQHQDAPRSEGRHPALRTHPPLGRDHGSLGRKPNAQQEKIMAFRRPALAPKPSERTHARTQHPPLPVVQH